MPRNFLELAADLQERTLKSENQRLAHDGIEPASWEAVPHYTAWIRTDVVLIAGLLTTLVSYVRWIVLLLAAIAIMFSVQVFR